uniref:Galactosyltransferase C-terminal domain-containing protein n=1 Tax=Alexandrium monilatum TaxID=311494 RepID=A0A7S4PTK2_9DINO
MKPWFVGGCVATLAILTLVNAWWQHEFYASQFATLENERAALAEELASHRRDLSMQRMSLGNCRSELQQAREEVHKVSRNEGDLSRHWSAELDGIKADRDSLANDLRACQERVLNLGPLTGKVPSRSRRPRLSNSPPGGRSSAPAASPQDTAVCHRKLESAIRELRRLRNTAYEHALDAQAATARLAVGTRAVATRVRAMQETMTKHIRGLEARVGAAVAMHSDHLAQMASDIGVQVDASRFRRKTLLKLDEWVKNAEERPAGNLAEGQGGLITGALQRLSLRGGPRPKAPPIKKDRHIGSVTSKGSAAKSQACVASIVPFRGRGEHLELFYRHIARFLESPEASRLCWSFYVVEQYDTELFNRGWLFNVGFAMAQLESRTFSCLVIQDLDTLPELGASIDFSNCTVPTQLSSEIECYGWLPPYAYNAGGVVSMSGDHWHLINGFANSYEGWGGEDDDLRLRLLQLNLLRGTCGSFCHLTDRAFRLNQKDLIRRPALGHGRFICLDEKSHTPRKHGDMGSMQRKLKEMEMGSDRWAFDGLSSLHFELVQHQTRPFPNTTHGTTLHWVKAVPSLNLRFGPDRVQLLLAEGACSAACEEAKRCTAHPSQLPLSISDLQAEVAIAFGDCLVAADSDPLSAASSLGYWLIDRHIVVTSLHGTAWSAGGSHGSGDEAGAATSWVLSETLREALSSPVNGEPALVIRAVPVRQLDAAVSRFRSDLLRQQQPIISACVGIFKLEDRYLRMKHTVNVGSDDCEQRSWTHLASFKVLRHRRSPEDTPVCIGEADEVWTARIGRGLENCTGRALGIFWRHKAVFYIGHEAQGKELCVRKKQERGRYAKWSRWQILVNEGGNCDDNDDGYKTEFTFRSMEDVYRPPRLYLCAQAGSGNRLKLALGCSELASSPRYAVLGAEYAHDEGEVYCLGRSRAGDRISRGRDCSSAEQGARWEHIASFAVPANATGSPWCLGKRLVKASRHAGKGTQEQFRVASMLNCSDRQYEHVLGFREVALAEMTQEHGLLSLRAM